MPFDGSEGEWRRSDPKRSKRDETIITVIIVALAVMLLLMPLTVGSLADIVHYLRAH